MDNLYENVRKALIEGKYDALMRKALGTNRLPKDHNYTSAVASNGDFVVHNANGKVVGRIKKGEHDAIKEEIGDITVKSKSSADAYAQHTGQDAKKTSVPKDPKTGKTLYQKVTSEETEELDEMDKSVEANPYHGWGHSKGEVSNGPEKTATPVTTKQMNKKAGKAMGDAFKKAFKEEAEQIDEVAAEIDDIRKTLQSRMNRIYTPNHPEKKDSARLRSKLQRLKKKQAAMKEEAEQVDEVSTKTLRKYERDTQYGGTHKNVKGNQIARAKLHGTADGYRARVPANEEVEQVDEVSTKLATSFYDKGKDQPKRAKSVALAFEKIRARHAKVAATEEVDQIDEDKVRVGTLAQRSQSYRDDKALEAELQAQRQTKKSVEDAKKKYGVKEEAELEEATVKSNKDGESGGRGKTFSSGSPNSYKVVGKDGEHLATANNMKDPKYGGRTTHWHVTWHKKEHKDSPTSFQFMDQLKKYAKELDEHVQIDEISAELAARAGDAADEKVRLLAKQRKFGSNPSPLESKLRKQTRKFDNYSDKKQGYAEEVDLEEGRGRPRKVLDHVVNPNNKEKLYFDNPEHAAKIEKLRKNGVLPPVKKEPSEHIINRLGQASTNMTGGQHITYDNGKTHRVTNSLASRTLAHYRGLKPADKETFQKKIAKSHEDHINALSGK